MPLPLKQTLRRLIASLQSEIWIRIWGQPYDLRVLILQIFAVLLIVAAVVGGFLYTKTGVLDRLTQVFGQPDKAELELAYEEGSKLPSFKALDNLMQFHENTLGFNKIKSLHVQGEMFDGQTTVQLKIMAKPPESYFQALEMDNKILEIRFVDGKLVYDQNSPLINSEDEDLAKVNRVLMVMECAVPLPAWLYADPTSNAYLERKYDEIYQSTKCAVIENTVLNDVLIRHYIDLETGQELSRQTAVGDYRLRVDYEALKPVGEVLFPSGYSVFLNNKFVCKATFDRTQINRTLPGFLFK